MKKFLALLLAAMMLLASVSCFAEEAAAVITFGDLTSEDAEYDPNTEYDKWTVIEYYLEGADATLIITCSAKADDSEYYMEYSFYGDDQLVKADGEGNVIEDKTGFMGSDTPAIVEYIKENAVWATMDGEIIPAETTAAN